MYLMVDNYDSFTAMLASYFEELGAKLSLVENDQVSIELLERLRRLGALEGIVISPGPKSPSESGACQDVVRWAARTRTPTLGVCLGHQVIGQVFGARVRRGARPMHGKISTLTANGQGIFQGLPAQFEVTRYHSLVVDEETLPACLTVDARCTDGAVMALRHTDLPVYGVQFHPEAARTQYGHDILANFLSIAHKEAVHA